MTAASAFTSTALDWMDEKNRRMAITDCRKGIAPVVNVTGLIQFDQLQLNSVIAVCRKSASLSDAGRTLYAASRTEKVSPNDADRLRKYLARFHLTWQQVTAVSF